MTGATVSAVETAAVEVVQTVETAQAEPAGKVEAVETTQVEPAAEVEAVEEVVEVVEVVEEPAAEAAPADSPALQPIPLTDADCVKCHYTQAADIDAHGEAHKDLSCMDCHEEHPPEGTNTIPECSNCHDPDDEAHFAVQQPCSVCHNPHRPLLVDFTAPDEVAATCASCHQDKLDEMAASPSAHSEQDCNSCHSEHGLGEGQYQTCLDCHEGHSPEMTVKDCLECHKPHSPTDITFGDSVPATLCASCHEDQADSLKALQTKHSEMACVECHDGKHQSITACVDCHDQPHDEFMHKQFPECITCHRDPHNLAR